MENYRRLQDTKQDFRRLEETLGDNGTLQETIYLKYFSIETIGDLMTLKETKEDYKTTRLHETKKTTGDFGRIFETT